LELLVTGNVASAIEAISKDAVCESSFDDGLIGSSLLGPL